MAESAIAMLKKPLYRLARRMHIPVSTNWKIRPRSFVRNRSLWEDFLKTGNAEGRMRAPAYRIDKKGRLRLVEQLVTIPKNPGDRISTLMEIMKSLPGEQPTPGTYRLPSYRKGYYKLKKLPNDIIRRRKVR